MPTVINNRSTLETDPIRNFRFLVIFKPLVSGDATWLQTGTAAPKVAIGFTSVSGLSVTTDSIPYREGGYNTTVHQIPGQTTFSPLTLQRGVVLGTPQHWNWMRQMFSTIQGGAARTAAQNFRADVEIQVLAHPIPTTGTATAAVAATGATKAVPASTTDTVAMRFQVYNAWPTSVSYSDLNAGDNAIFVEQLTLVHEGFDVNWGSAINTTAAEFEA